MHQHTRAIAVKRCGLIGFSARRRCHGKVGIADCHLIAYRDIQQREQAGIQPDFPPARADDRREYPPERLRAVSDLTTQRIVLSDGLDRRQCHALFPDIDHGGELQRQRVL